MAYRASRNDTWINNYSPFVSAWSSDPDADTLTEAEVHFTAESCLLLTLCGLPFGWSMQCSRPWILCSAFVSFQGCYSFSPCATAIAAAKPPPSAASHCVLDSIRPSPCAPASVAPGQQPPHAPSPPPPAPSSRLSWTAGSACPDQVGAIASDTLGGPFLV